MGELRGRAWAAWEWGSSASTVVRAERAKHFKYTALWRGVRRGVAYRVVSVGEMGRSMLRPYKGKAEEKAKAHSHDWLCHTRLVAA